MNADSRHPSRGFTLIEVLVALAIIALGLVAVFGQMSQSATAATRLRDKTLAHWVALNKITELRLSGQYPGVGTQSDNVEMARLRWRYEVKISETEGDYLRRAEVAVSLADEPARPLAIAVGFIAQPTAGQGAGPSALDWSLPNPDEVGSGTGSPNPNPNANPNPNPTPPPTGGNEAGNEQ